MGGGGVKSLCQWGSRALLMRPTAVRKKLFLWREVSVLISASCQMGVCVQGETFVSRVGGVSYYLP